MASGTYIPCRVMAYSIHICMGNKNRNLIFYYNIMVENIKSVYRVVHFLIETCNLICR